MSAAAPPDAQSAAQPVTAPEFGAAYLHNPAPAYPAAALRQGWEGTVLLKVHVLANGQPDQVLVASTSGHPVLDDAAVEVVTPWRFVPAKRAAQTIDGWVKVPIISNSKTEAPVMSDLVTRYLVDGALGVLGMFSAITWILIIYKAYVHGRLAVDDRRFMARFWHGVNEPSFALATHEGDTAGTEGAPDTCRH